MGMAVKGENEHRMVRVATRSLLTNDTLGLVSPRLTEAERQSCKILIRRADLALDRIKKRKHRRATHVAHLAAMPKSPEGW